MVVILKKGSAVRSSRDSVAFDFRGRIELRRRSRGRIIDSTANLKVAVSIIMQLDCVEYNSVKWGLH